MTHSLNSVFFKLFETGDIEIAECDYLIPEYSDPVSKDIRRRWDNIAEEFRGKQIKELEKQIVFSMMRQDTEFVVTSLNALYETTTKSYIKFGDFTVNIFFDATSRFPEVKRIYIFQLQHNSNAVRENLLFTMQNFYCISITDRGHEIIDRLLLANKEEQKRQVLKIMNDVFGR